MWFPPKPWPIDKIIPGCISRPAVTIFLKWFPPEICFKKVYMQSADPPSHWVRLPPRLIETAKCYISNHLFPQPLPLVLLRDCQLVSIHLSHLPSAASAPGPFVSQQLLVPLESNVPWVLASVVLNHVWWWMPQMVLSTTQTQSRFLAGAGVFPASIIAGVAVCSQIFTRTFGPVCWERQSIGLHMHCGTFCSLLFSFKPLMIWRPVWPIDAASFSGLTHVVASVQVWVFVVFGAFNDFCFFF